MCTEGAFYCNGLRKRADYERRGFQSNARHFCAYSVLKAALAATALYLHAFEVHNGTTSSRASRPIARHIPRVFSANYDAERLYLVLLAACHAHKH